VIALSHSSFCSCLRASSLSLLMDIVLPIQ
jgi:hypothetical protein